MPPQTARADTFVTVAAAPIEAVPNNTVALNDKINTRFKFHSPNSSRVDDVASDRANDRIQKSSVGLFRTKTTVTSDSRFD